MCSILFSYLIIKMDFLALLITLLILDSLWINLFFIHRFAPMIQSVQNSPMVVNRFYFILTYLIFALLLYIVLPKSSSILEAFMIGFLIFGIYDFTNLSTLKNWELSNAMMDSVWGGVLVASTYVILNHQ
jgi:uncharacterized membrane protein